MVSAISMLVWIFRPVAAIKRRKKRIKFLIKKQKNKKSGAREQNYVFDILLRASASSEE